MPSLVDDVDDSGSCAQRSFDLRLPGASIAFIRLLRQSGASIVIIITPEKTDKAVP